MPELPTASPKHVQWVAFDLVGTLIYPDPPVAEVYEQVGRRFGSRLSAAEVSSRFRGAFAESEHADRQTLSQSGTDELRTSEDREYQRWQRIVLTVLDDVSAGEACFRQLFEHFARPDSWRCFDDVAPTFAALTRANYRLAIASNFDSRLHAVCDGLPPLDRTSVRLVSSEVGFRKPSPRFFAQLLRTTNSVPSAVHMVGDDYENDIAGARNAGLHAIQVCRGTHQNMPGQVTTLMDVIDIIA